MEGRLALTLPGRGRPGYLLDNDEIVEIANFDMYFDRNERRVKTRQNKCRLKPALTSAG